MPFLPVEEIERIFHSHVPNLGRIPHIMVMPYATVAFLSELTQGDPAHPKIVEEIGSRNDRALLWDQFRSAAANMQKTIDTLYIEATASAKWDELAERYPELGQLREALKMLAEKGVLGASDEVRRPGPETQDDDHFLAAGIAEIVIEVLQAAGYSQKPSRTSGKGPVARIGAQIMGAAQGQNVLNPVTFASWVKKWDNRKPGTN